MIYLFNYALIFTGGKGGAATDRKMLSFGRGDWIAVVLVVALALGVGLLFLPSSNSGGEVVQIYQDGELIRELPLTAEALVEITGKYENTVEVHNGSVAMICSTCPGEDCVHSGRISRAGRSLVCLPNGVEIRIIGSADIDFVVG